MSQNKLIIFPGLSSPFHEDYRGIYKGICEALNYKGVETELLLYPGQINSSGISNGRFSINKAINEIVPIINESLEDNIIINFLGISSGCHILSGVLDDLNISKHINKAVLWAPIPHWYNWFCFGKDRNEFNLGKGTLFIDSFLEYYKELVPLEFSLGRKSVKLLIGLGSKDKHVHSSYLTYLEEIHRDKPNISYHFIHECSHNPSNLDDGFSNFINLLV